MKFNTLKYLTILLGIIPVLFFVYYVLQYTINVPYVDDSLYYTKCVIDVEESNSIIDKFWIFMKQHIWVTLLYLG